MPLSILWFPGAIDADLSSPTATRKKAAAERVTLSV